MSTRRRRPAAGKPTGRTAELNEASLAVVLPWVYRTATQAVQRGWIRLADYDAGEQLALLRAMAKVLEHQRAAA
jgi:hypothetical protein